MQLADNLCSFLYHDYVTCRTSSHILTVCCCAVNWATGRKWGQVTFSSLLPYRASTFKSSCRALGSLRRGCQTQRHAEGELYYLQRSRFVEAVKLNDTLRASCTTFRGLASSRLSYSMTCWGYGSTSGFDASNLDRPPIHLSNRNSNGKGLPIAS